MKISNILDLYRGQGSSSSTQLKSESAAATQAQPSTEAVKVDPSLARGNTNSDRAQYVSQLKAKIEAGEYNPSSKDVATALLYGKDAIV